jgi:hypothetical protein
MLQPDPSESERLANRRRGRALAWASIASWALGCVYLVLMLTADHAPVRDEVGAGIRAIGWLLAMTLLAVGALIGFILARLAERRIAGDHLVMIAYAANIVTLVVASLVAAYMFVI